MAAPVVQNLSDLVTQIGQAYAPEKAQIDSSIAANETSGQAQQAGLDAKKTQAFGQIDQTASDRGMAYSGQGIDNQSKYLGSTYLPALANLQNTIASTRNSLLGKKAALDTAANTEAFTTQQNQQKELQAYNDAQDAAARAEQARIESQNFTASENEKNRQAQMAAANARAAAAAASKQPTAADIMKADSAAIGQALHSATGRDGYVSPQSYAAAKADWVNQGYSSKAFDDTFSNYRNPANRYYKVG